MNFYYVNHVSERIGLSDFPYIFQEGNLLDWQYTYDTINGSSNHTKNYKKDVKEIPCKIAVLGDFSIPIEERKKAWKEAVNRLVEIFDVDVASEEDGKLWTDTGYYMNCKITASEKSDWKMGLPIMFNTVTVLADNPFWIREEQRSFLPLSSGASGGDFLDYPYDYDYDYAGTGGNVSWNIDHYAPSHFKMVIYGPCIDPHINIADHPYIVHDVVEKGEYIEVDSRNNSVIKHRTNGTIVDLFDYRGKIEGSLFEPIPSGNVPVNWNGSFGFDVTLFCERSEPAW